MEASLARHLSARFLFTRKPGEHIGNSLSACSLFFSKPCRWTAGGLTASDLLFLERTHQRLLDQ